ncbi:hypothetical protein BGZ80_007560 [Entomortierella chlamydospora]|uniref:F-box domain-containing protein n=1 Tax=Entomortierella chlamydospora TaxID=101097 RepID=A0A9P6N4U7_9FUNG|nr:hypothetical protein BGZ79_007064 [Entomortierella chlamydospora]KAG0023868.1 hypothetical protein BGZ80_007560 [Entomortierella chlamydospora]
MAIVTRRSTNPLEIFEVVSNVGRFVQLWRCPSWGSRDPWEEPKFYPREILSYTLVSKTWRAALLPVCWEFYDGKAMYGVPHQVISHYSHYFRTMTNCLHRGPFNSKHLRKLEIQYNYVYCRIYSKKIIEDLQLSISELSWIAGANGTPSNLDLSNDGEVILMKLSLIVTVVKDFTLKNWLIYDVPELLRFLARCTRLSKISLHNIYGIKEFPYSTSTMESMSIPQPYILLPTVTTLHLDFTPESSKAALEMMTCCPNLTHLEIVGSWVSSECTYTSTPIYRYCPNLRSISINIAGRSQEGGRSKLRKNELANLVVNLVGMHGTGKLNTFKATLFELDEAVAEALVKHTKDTLEIFEVYLDGFYCIQKDDQQESFDNIHHILKNCCNLKIFSIQYDCDYYSTDYLGGSWACLDTLEELKIHGGWYGESSKQFEDVEVSSNDGCTWIWRAGGGVSVSPGMLEWILVVVKSMPRLKRLSINGSRIYKIKKVD